MMKFKNMQKCFSKIEVQEDKTHPNHLSQTILNRLFGRVLESEGVNVSCAEHTEKNLSSNRLIVLTTLKNKLDCFAFARNDALGEGCKDLPSPDRHPLPGEGNKVLCAKHTEKDLFSYSPIHLFTSKKVAFTLAEVLITLGIIGVVAALTIPNVIKDYQKKQTVVQLRKVYNDINNAVKLSEVDNGPMSQWDYVKTTCQAYECMAPFLEKYYLPYFKDAQLLTKSELPNYTRSLRLYLNSGFIRLNNGVLLNFFSNTPGGYIWLFADINGEKGPNIVGKDIFVFDAYNHGESLQVDGLQVYRIKFWFNHISNKDVLTASHQYACRKDNDNVLANFTCGRFIELNDWEIPKDYPW